MPQNEVYVLCPGDIVNVLVKETGQPIKTGNPATIQKTAVYKGVISVYFTEPDGTKRILPMKKFRYLKA